MGLFSFVTDIFKPVTKPIERTIRNITPKPVRSVARPILRTAKSITPSSALRLAAKGPVLGPIEFATKAVAPKALPLVQLGTSIATAAVPGGGAVKMGLDLGGILGTVSNIFGGNQNPIFQGISGISGAAGQLITAANQSTLPAIRNPMVGAGSVAVRPMTRALGTVGRSFFQKFPNLATSIQQLRDRGMNVKRSQLWNLLKRFGPEVVISGGLLTAAAVNELMVAGPGRRTMNPANAKALRRAARRIKSFHKLCGTADLIKSRGRRSSVGRCVTCRKSPCRC